MIARRAGHLLALTTLFLLGVGVIMLVSTGRWTQQELGAYFNLKRHFGWMVLGLVCCAGAVTIPYHWWRRISPWTYLLACLLLVCCFLPWVGERNKGASRWVTGEKFHLGFVHFQPSEFAKLAIVLTLAAWYVQHGRESSSLKKGFFIPLAFIALPVGLIAAEVDVGASVLIGLSSFALMFAAGANLLAVILASVGGLGCVVGAICLIPNRWQRWQDFLDLHRHPLDHLDDTGQQQVRAMMAFASGGGQGVGLGNGLQKIYRMPEAHTDFIFPMIGEELGLWATLLTVIGYVVFFAAGCMISVHAPDRFGRLLGFGLTLLVTLQALLNIGVTTATLPNKGLPLPFVSYGGSNLMFCMIAVGLLLNLHRHAVFPEDERPSGLPGGRFTPRL